jgi:SAM-dependent methyltransferase
MMTTINRNPIAFVCPDCKGPLTALRCEKCNAQFCESGGIPQLLSKDANFAAAAEFGSTYDEIYSRRTSVWEDQGRTPAFIRYFSELAAGFSTDQILEIGCGEGFLLRDLRATEKTAVDISAAALRRAATRVNATFCVAAAERLPFPAGSFDLVVSVGVMEHFLDDAEATSEIRRVLRPDGHYLALIHTALTWRESARQKIRQYIFPRLRPWSLVRWAGRKVYRPVHQPIQHKYTLATGRLCLEQAGFRVESTVSRATEPSAPLVGPHVVIYVARK